MQSPLFAAFNADMILAARSHMEFLESTLIPDLEESGTVHTAEDFKKCCFYLKYFMARAGVFK